MFLRRLINPIGTLACIASLVQCSAGARADVTVVMAGTIAVSPTMSMPQTTIDAMRSVLNATFYYHSHYLRSETGLYTSLFDFRSNKGWLVNKRNDETTRLGRHGNTLTMRSSTGREYNDTIFGGFNLKLVKANSMSFAGHRCRSYSYSGTYTVKNYGNVVGISALEIIAVDFPGVENYETLPDRSRARGIPLFVGMNVRGPTGDLDFQSQESTISTDRLSASAFDLHNYVPDVEVLPDVGVSPVRGSLPSARPSTAPVAITVTGGGWDSFNEKDGVAKAEDLIKAEHFDDAEALVRSLTQRKLTSELAPIYNELGDNAMVDSRNDIAWGWYTLAVKYGTAPADIVYARFALAKYSIAHKDNDDAVKNLQAIIDLPGASDADKSSATSQITALAPKPPAWATPPADTAPPGP